MTTDPLAALLTPLTLVTPSGELVGRRFAPIPAALLELARRQWGLVSSQQADEAGVDVDRRRRLVLAGRWVKVVPGVYLVVPSSVLLRDWAERHCQRAMVGQLAGGPRTLPSGLAALSLAGIQGAPLRYRPEIAAFGSRRRSTPAVRVRRVTLSADPATRLRALSLPTGHVVAPSWALAQVAAEVELIILVALIDSGLHTSRLTSDLLDLSALVLAGRPGGAALAEARALADGRSESVLETRARLQCEDHGVGPDDLQHEVRTRSGTFVARCDMVWHLGGGRLLIIELDGEHHRLDGRIRKDNARDNELMALGHRVFHLGWDHLATGEIWRTVLRVLVEEGRLPREARVTLGAR